MSLYLEGIQFKSRRGDRMYRQIFCGFIPYSQEAGLILPHRLAGERGKLHAPKSEPLLKVIY